MCRLILVAVVFMANLCGAQTLDPLIFREKIYDFGEIQETRGNANHEFVFTNNAGRPVKILNVAASCGCTTPGWSKDAIAPGKTGFVKASFDPKGRPGYFNKTLTVLTDLDPNPMVLQIKGTVVVGTAVEDDDFAVAMGNLMMKTKSFSMGTVYINKEPMRKEFAVMNGGSEPLKFLSVAKPQFVKVEMPAVLEPKQKGVIAVTYDAKMKNAFGFASDNIQITTNDVDAERKSISLFATLEEYYAPPTAEEMLTAPQAVLREQSIDLGQYPPGASLERKVTVVNKGKKELRIKALQGNCPCISATAENRMVKAGDSTQIKILFKPQARGGTQQKAITMYTNDPRNPIQWLNVQVYIID